jgi:MerR family transcriptional regulator/heat shock protein HspR
MTGYERDALYVISIAAQILQLHPQTLRLYEREGLVEPQRSRGGIRLYSESDIERVRAIQRLTSELGVNLAGAEVILNMREMILELQDQIAELHRELDIDL